MQGRTRLRRAGNEIGRLRRASPYQGKNVAVKRAVVLLSGGLDSATTLAICRGEGFEAGTLSFDYGQRHNIELQAAKRVAASFGVREHRVAQIDLRIFGR